MERRDRLRSGWKRMGSWTSFLALMKPKKPRRKLSNPKKPRRFHTRSSPRALTSSSKLGTTSRCTLSPTRNPASSGQNRETTRTRIRRRRLSWRSGWRACSIWTVARSGIRGLSAGVLFRMILNISPRENTKRPISRAYQCNKGTSL